MIEQTKNNDILKNKLQSTLDRFNQYLIDTNGGNEMQQQSFTLHKMLNGLL